MEPQVRCRMRYGKSAFLWPIRIKDALSQVAVAVDMGFHQCTLQSLRTHALLATGRVGIVKREIQ